MKLNATSLPPKFNNNIGNPIKPKPVKPSIPPVVTTTIKKNETPMSDEHFSLMKAAKQAGLPTTEQKKFADANADGKMSWTKGNDPTPNDNSDVKADDYKKLVGTKSSYKLGEQETANLKQQVKEYVAKGGKLYSNREVINNPNQAIAGKNGIATPNANTPNVGETSSIIPLGNEPKTRFSVLLNNDGKPITNERILTQFVQDRYQGGNLWGENYNQIANMSIAQGAKADNINDKGNVGNKKVVYFEVSVKDQVKIHENYKIVQDRVNAVEKSVDEINKANPVSQFIMGAVDGVKDNIVGTATMITHPLETLGAIKDVAVALSSLTAEDVGKIAEAVKGKISDTFTTKDGINSIPYGAGYAVGMLATDIVVGKGVGIALKGLKGIPAIGKLLTKLEDLKLATQGKIAETFSNDAASLAKENFIKRMKVIGANPNNITNIALDPELWTNATKVAGNTLAKGYKSFAEFSAKMIDELGETVKPYLEKLHREGLTTLDLKPDFTNSKEVEKFLGKAVKDGDKLPDGYNWREGQIVRSANKAEAGYMPLKFENGRIMEREGSDRLSKATVMNRNFEKSIKEEIKAKNPNYTEKQIEAEFKLEKARVQIHHIIPDEIVQTSELGKAAQKAGYDLDRASNLDGLPNKNSFDPNKDKIGHWGSHKDYSKSVRNEIEQTTRKLKAKFQTKNLEDIPPETLKNEMKKIEDYFRNLLKTGEVPNKGGRLSLIPSNVGGNYDVRV